MAITTIQCKSEAEELLFPQIDFDQIIDPVGIAFEESWELLKNEILRAIYPIGSVIILESSYNPNELFPNTAWERTSEGKILVGKGYLNGSTSSTLVENDSSVSSAYSVQITSASMPSHTHNLYKRTTPLQLNGDDYDYGNSGSYAYSAYTGGGGYHSNVMPYICVNIWTRVKDNNLDSGVLDEIKLR